MSTQRDDKPYDPTSPPTALRYTGDGSRFLRGLPQRDLTADDLAAIPDRLLVEGTMSGLYEVPSKRDQDAMNKAAGDAATEPVIPADPAGSTPAGDAGGDV